MRPRARCGVILSIKDRNGERVHDWWIAGHDGTDGEVCWIDVGVWDAGSARASGVPDGEGEVLRLGADAMAAGDLASLRASPTRSLTGVEWRVEELAIGAARFARIDDATGAVLEVGRYRKR